MSKRNRIIRPMLAPYCGQVCRFRGTLDRWSGYPQDPCAFDRCIVTHLKIVVSGVSVGHAWLDTEPFDNCFTRAAAWLGDEVEFDAEVIEYRKGYVGQYVEIAIRHPERWGYALANPANVVVVSRCDADGARLCREAVAANRQYFDNLIAEFDRWDSLDWEDRLEELYLPLALAYLDDPDLCQTPADAVALVAAFEEEGGRPLTDEQEEELLRELEKRIQDGDARSLSSC